MIPPVVDAAWVGARPEVILADVRWYPDGRDPAAAFGAGHLPRAVRLDLDRWLAGPPSTSGRHPLPAPERFAEGLYEAGIGRGDVVVGYDDAGGVMAARLVWMMRAWGCDAALLDGGMQAWTGQLEVGDGRVPELPEEPVAARPWPPAQLADIDEVAGAPSGTIVLLDARPADRYAGAPDDLDPRAGHIPGARSLSCRGHLADDGRLLPVVQLRARLDAVGAGEGGAAVVSSCGSGVTACHTLLVLEHAGLPAGRLYPGSWSEWSRSDRPIATGGAPA